MAEQREAGQIGAAGLQVHSAVRLPIGVNNISSQFSTDYSVVLAYTTLAMIPALIFYAIAERQIIGGLTNGAVKE